MASQRAIQSALHNFVGSYVSRYSDYGGYWLFGMLVGELENSSIDLLGPNPIASERTPMEAAVQLAKAKFHEQAKKAGIDLSRIKEARLFIKRSASPMAGKVNGHTVSGHEYVFLARAVSDRERQYSYETRVFIARHDPKLERQTARTPNLSRQNGPAASGRPLS